MSRDRETPANDDNNNKREQEGKRAKSTGRQRPKPRCVSARRHVHQLQPRSESEGGKSKRTRVIDVKGQQASINKRQGATEPPQQGRNNRPRRVAEWNVRALSLLQQAPPSAAQWCMYVCTASKPTSFLPSRLSFRPGTGGEGTKRKKRLDRQSCAVAVARPAPPSSSPYGCCFSFQSSGSSREGRRTGRAGCHWSLRMSGCLSGWLAGWAG